MIFDPNMTKKKKKKKKPFMLDDEGGEGVGGDEAKEVETKEAEPEMGEDKELDLDEDESRKKGLDNFPLFPVGSNEVWNNEGLIYPF